MEKHRTIHSVELYPIYYLKAWTHLMSKYTGKYEIIILSPSAVKGVKKYLRFSWSKKDYKG